VGIHDIINPDKDMNFIYSSSGGGSWANENAFKAAFIHKHSLLTNRE